MRFDGRSAGALRRTRIYRSCLRHPQGSALIEMGNTKVVCAATVEDTVPGWLRGTGKGWVTAEYGMLPGSVTGRAGRGNTGGRAQEIQRLIGRSLRAVVDLSVLGERRITIDCDVLDADGGTRTASVTAAYVALREAVDKLLAAGALAADPLVDSVAAVSVGIVRGQVLLDLAYEEDSVAEVDFNVVATGAGRLVEVQGTAEHGTFTPRDTAAIIRLALRGIGRLQNLQTSCLARPPRTTRTIL
ncbi:MAG: ribonuclease PH [Candidatus Eisenbacteria bacterium]